ncbi:DEAD/DEAH box helicase [Pseudovibrio exalbescens]|uniref:DEAD/DEAH box helicase n=1 Tax=Pseudovibrio exalbescens TaxID=197461 RepID=UPI0023660C63|nr:DEAD/DEAH box helicase [Pseudovibrio exalbescens]MDD7909590.1 DEAD/DEAH box helicase [Pseudovibrio exalbescens]
MPAKRKYTLLSEFEGLGLSKPLLLALEKKEYGEPTPIQRQAIPIVLEGHDLLGLAQTGTGKTAAFSLPLLQRLNESRFRASPRGVRSLILAPTRELADQIATSVKGYAGRLPIQVGCVVGGVPMLRQIRAIQRGLDVLVATPGRLMDLHRRGAVHFDDLEVFVLDEADQMMDMGFIHVLTEIAALLPKERQSMFFSATMPNEIAKLADKFLTNPQEVSVAPPATTVESVEQKLAHLREDQKGKLLLKLLGQEEVSRVIVFTRTKHRANKVAKFLAANNVTAEAIHGNKSQPQRIKTMEAFKGGRLKVLVATDIAARGIDVSDVSTVINYDMPNVDENYVHRIGRTARAGKEGQAFSFVIPEERGILKTVERLTRQEIPVLEGFEFFHSDAEPKSARRGRSGGARKPNSSKPAGSRTGAAKAGASKAGGRGKPAAAQKRAAPAKRRPEEAQAKSSAPTTARKPAAKPQPGKASKPNAAAQKSKAGKPKAKAPARRAQSSAGSGPAATPSASYLKRRKSS